MAIQIKRIYDPFSENDGLRFLVDRLWPRGVSKESARLDGWLKALAPSTELRTWFGHMEKNLSEFSKLYRAELDASAAAQTAARDLLRKSEGGMVTLLYAARDAHVNHAVVLKAYLEEKASGA